MANEKFTPEPWRNYAPEIKHEVDEDYRTIAAGLEFFPRITDGQGFSVTGCINKADADLMTAAPALYKALENALNRLGEIEFIYGIDLEKEIEEIEKALAKARGEQ